MTSKLVSAITDNIYQNSDFQKDYRDLILSKFTNSNESLTREQIKRLVESASVLALNQNNAKFQKIAFKITIFLLETLKNKYEFLPYLAQIILARLGDLPTIQYMINSEDSKDYFSFLDSPVELKGNDMQLPEIISSKIFNQEEIGNIKYNLTDFQSKILLNLKKKLNVSFSAPTSAGKSFIVHKFITEQLQHNDTYCAVYIAPTKSLIKEVQDSLKQNLKNYEDVTKKILIFNSVNNMNIDKIIKVEKKIFVMTQERLQQMVANEYEIQVQLLVVDEAQKVSEYDRGVIIEDAVYDLMSSNPAMQKIFISPNADPNRFKQIFNINDRINTFKTTKTPVGQNFFDVIFSKKPKRMNLSLFSYEFNKNIPLYDKKIEKNVEIKTMSVKKALVVTDIIQRKDPTLVYCNTRSDCRTVCKYISKYSERSELSDKLKESIDFIKTHVHSEYYLLDHLDAGIGYHYGKMPHFVRLVVKDLYENKQIDTLCCTSTLIEGVNLPAKNVVLFNPKLGKTLNMDKTSLNNIAGRAGRLLKDYYGDIYCIDREEWFESDPFDPEIEIEPIKSATEKILSKNTADVLEYLKNSLTTNNLNQGTKSVAINLMTKYFQVLDIDGYLNTKCKSLDPEIKGQIITHLQEISTSIKDLNRSVILKNRGIDPRFQHHLYKFLKTPKNLILPPFPDDRKNFYNNLLQIFEIISRIIFHKSNKSYIYFGTLAVNWIKGYPYKQLLAKKIELSLRKNEEKDKAFINRVIDELDDDIETEIKFEYTRALQCYCDIVGQILNENNSDEPFCVNLPEYLEAGAWDPRIFLLIDAGFTRTSALYLYTKMEPEISNVDDCIAWIRKNKSNVLEWLPTSLHVELDLILDES